MTITRISRGVRRRLSAATHNLSRRLASRGDAVSSLLASTILWFGLFREARAIAVGMREYSRHEDRGTQVNELRRRIHMLEKGLVMRPRRDTFAAGYIEWTVSTAIAVESSEHPLISSSETEWIASTLGDYFSATGLSSDNAIINARRRFETEFGQKQARQHRGPHAPYRGVAHGITYEQFSALAQGRQSVRWFLEKPVDRCEIDRALLAAAEAPSACNRQPYRFLVIDDPELLRQAVDIPMGTAGYGHSIPSLAVLIGNTGAFEHERDRHLIYIDASLAAMSFVYALETLGLSSCCINWPDLPDKHAQIERLLGMSAHEKVVMLIAIGHADPSGLVPYSQKRSLDAVRTYNLDR